MVKKKHTVISLFCGCGGSSLGYKLAGFKELLAVDWDRHAETVFQDNFHDVPFWNRNVVELEANEILKRCNIQKGELDVLDGSPPCQGFSISGKRKVNDSRNMLFENFVRIIQGLEPKVFLMENVPGMVRGKMKGMFIEIMKSLKALDYEVECRKLNAMHYNVPQSRERLFFIGVRKDLGIKPVFPKPNPKWTSVKDALKGVPEDTEIKYFEGKSSIYMKKTKQGEQASDYHPNGSMFNFVRLQWAKPSNTITKTMNQRMSGLAHPEEDRFLTISELKRLSSFPDNFKMSGKFEEKWARIGNAVMPNQMRAIAQTIKEEILENV
jgi:DNA (cytosine-5)-methyltransferase 1